MIEVHRTGPGASAVTIREGDSEIHHQVTLSEADCARPGGGDTLETLMEAAFRFLLDRELKESILRRFDLTVISRCFPKFECERPRYLVQR